MTPTIHHLYISPGHNFYGRHGKGQEHHPIQDHHQIDLVAGRGIIGDRFFDYKEDYKGQITLFDQATYQAVKTQFNLPHLTPCAFRRNVVLSGLDLPSLIGQTFTLGGIQLSASEEAKPCYWMNDACAPGVEEFLKGQGGLRCRILTTGTLKK